MSRKSFDNWSPTGMIRINTNDSDEDPFSFAVTGIVLV